MKPLPEWLQKLGGRIRAMRNLRRLTQAQLGLAAGGIKQPIISQYESGLLLPGLLELHDLSVALGVTADNWVTGDLTPLREI